MAVFVLVHGAWGGSFGFAAMRGPLHSLGHEVFTPSLTGLGRDWLVPPLPREFDDPAEAAWVGVRRTPHPVGCFTEPVRLTRPLEDYSFTRTYIKATGDPRPESGAEHDGQPFTTAELHPRI